MVFAPKLKVAPEWRPLVEAAQAAMLAAHGGAAAAAAPPPPQQQQGTALEAEAEEQEHAAPPHEALQPLEDGAGEDFEAQVQEWRRRHEEQHRRAPPAGAGAHEAAAHAAFLGHPVARQLRTVPRGAGGADATAAGTAADARVLIGVRFPTVLDADLVRLLPGGARFAPAEAAAADWAAPLAALATAGGAAAGCAPRAHAEGARALTVSACAHELESVLSWLAEQPQAHWLEPRRQMRLHNRVASSITQGIMRGEPADDVTSMTMHPYWQPAVGLRGEGQVVGVGDSGLDMDSCYFFDPAVSFVANTRQEASGKVFSSDAHRKVAYYLGRADTQMTDGVGHGTHVCGSIAGLPLNSASDAADPGVGMAPGARIGFIDLSATGSNDVGVPDDLDKDYFPMAYERGVRIHSGARSRRGWGLGVAGAAGPG
jgi:hypothetical protein